jgi:hypothetical protein
MATKGKRTGREQTPEWDDNAPVIIRRVVRPSDVLKEEEKAGILHQLHLAIYWVQGGRKLPRPWMKELAALERRIQVTWAENMLVSRIHAAYKDGHPLSLADNSSGTGKTSAFEVIAKEDGKRPERIRDEYYRIKRATLRDGLPILANSPKPREKR